MESEIENWTAKAEAWRRHADLSRRRAAIVRKVAVMMRGTEPLPDGLTRAALVVCGTAWRGFEWVRRGVEVSPAVWEVERNAAADKLAFYAGEVAREAGKVSDAFHAADALAALRGESLTPPAEWTSPALERLRPIRDAVAGTLDALNEEGEAWRDFEAAYLEALEAVPVEEIESARARLEAEEARAKLDAGKAGGKPPRTGRKTGRPSGPKWYLTQKEAAEKLQVALTTIQKWEQSPENVPDEWLGYCAAVRTTEAAWNCWRLSLGQKEGFGETMEKAAAIQSGLRMQRRR